MSSTKLIIGQGHTGTHAAGNVIDGFANFIMSGSFVIGIVTFCVILIVNFMVITKGAARMAEVGARFALDGMPGKQLAIDSDVSSGAIDHETATLRRKRDQNETTFLGSLDGVSKFVKGDAIAGLLITLLNFFVGTANGVFAHGMEFSNAIEVYAILTVGDGLVTQIPAVIVSIASALLLAKGSNGGSVDIVIFEQLAKHPAALISVACLLSLIGFLPGLPALPFILGSLFFGYLGFESWKSSKSSSVEAEEPNGEPVVNVPQIGDILNVDDIHIEFSSDLVDMVLDPGGGLDNRIVNMRSHIAANFGFIVPEIRLTDNASLLSGTYVIFLQGVEHARGLLRPELVLAIPSNDAVSIPNGEDINEPVYGARARWLDKRHAEELVLDGVTVVSPNEVLATHLLEVIKNNLARLFTLKSLRTLLHEFSNLSNEVRAAANKKLLDELIPDRVPLELLHSVLKFLLDEKVSVRNLNNIMEAIAEARAYSQQPEAICELVRQRIGFQIVSDFKRDDGTVPLIQLSPEWENVFSSFEMGDEKNVQDVALPPDVFVKLTEAISTEIANVSQKGVNAPIVTSSKRRRFIRKIVQAKNFPVSVLSFEEIGLEARPSLVGTISS